jgi:hypothetical protein
MQYVFEMQNVSYNLDEDCTSVYTEAGEEWRCFFAEYAVEYVDTPFFISNALYDSYQLPAIYGLTCNPSMNDCNTTEISYMEQYAQDLVTGVPGVHVL